MNIPNLSIFHPISELITIKAIVYTIKYEMTSINSEYCIFLRNERTILLNIRELTTNHIIADIINPLFPNSEITFLALTSKKYIRKLISTIKIPFIVEKALKKERTSFNLLTFFSILIFKLNISLLHPSISRFSNLNQRLLEHILITSTLYQYCMAYIKEFKRRIPTGMRLSSTTYFLYTK